MVSAKKIRLMLLTPAVVAILILSGCLDKTPKTNQMQKTEQTQK